MTSSGWTNGARVDALDSQGVATDGSPDAPEDMLDLEGDARPALTPAQLAFLALIAALIVTAIRRLRRNRS